MGIKYVTMKFDPNTHFPSPKKTSADSWLFQTQLGFPPVHKGVCPI